MIEVRPLKLESFLNPGHPVTRIAVRDVAFCREHESISNALYIILRRFRKIPVLSRKNSFRGFVSAVDMLDYLGAGERHAKFQRYKNPLNAKIKGIVSHHGVSLSSRHSIRNALELAKEHRLGLYPILRKGKMLGILSERDIFDRIRGHAGISVGEFMIRRPMVVKEHFPVFDVAKIMVRTGYSRLPVVNRSMLTGMITPKDILSFLEKKKKLHKLRKETEPVKNAMKTGIVTARPEQDLSEAIKIMQLRKLGALPVTDDEGELLGIITERDVLELLN